MSSQNEEDNVNGAVVYKQKTNISPVVKYFFKCRPDLKDKLLVEQIKMFRDLASLENLLNVVACGRGFGKTMIAGAVGLYYADEWSTQNNKAINVLIVSSQKALYDNIEVFFRNRPDLVERLRVRSIKGWIPKDGIEFIDNYSRLIPAMATIHSVEGYRADIIIFDESQDIPEEVFEKALGCLRIDTIGKVIVIGTPYSEWRSSSSKLNWFIELVKNPKGYIKGFPFLLSQHPSNICSWNNTKLWKSKWSKQRYDAECLGIVTPVEERAFFPASNVKQCCLDIDPMREGKDVVEAGIDCGYNCTCLIFTEKLSSVKRKVLEIDIWEQKSIEDIAPEIAKCLNRMNVSVAKVDSKQGINVPSYVKEIKKYTRLQVVPIDASQKEKVVNDEGREVMIGVKWNMLGQLGRKLREKNLIISTRMLHSELLIEQLLKYNPRRGRKDDLVDALALSVYEPEKTFNKGECGRVVGPWSLKSESEIDKIKYLLEYGELS